MKVRWKNHEIILAVIITIIALSGYICRMSGPSAVTISQATQVNNISGFNYYKAILLPQIGMLFLVFLLYIATYQFTVPLFRKVSAGDLAGRAIGYITGGTALIFLSALLFTLGMNGILKMANPQYYNYEGFGIAAVVGYKSNSGNMLDGFSKVFGITAAVTALLLLREVFIHYVTRAGNRRPYFIKLMNQISAFLVIYLSFPFFVSTFHLITADTFYAAYYSVIPGVFLVFLSNIYWVFPIKDKGSVVSAVIRLLLTTLLISLPFILVLARHFQEFGRVLLLCWIIQLLIVTPLSWLFYSGRKDSIMAMRGAEKALERSRADLQLLRSQINPHFLFNALNTLYGTALMDGSKTTASGIQRLGDMMRFILHENNHDFIAMEDEIAYMRNYICLQKLRTDATPDILIEDNLDESQHCNHLIAPMLLIPFIENAFKHGIGITGSSWIKIKLKCDDKNIHFEVRNSLHPVTAHDPEKDKSGIGLNNVAERLQLLYPDSHRFERRENGTEHIIRLSISPSKATK